MSRGIIICVDDEMNVLVSLRQQLSRILDSEYAIELAESGKEALNLFAELDRGHMEVALIICDQTMPEMSGVELLSKLHAQFPKTMKILLTGVASLHDAIDGINHANLYRYITKPWNETDLSLTGFAQLMSDEVLLTQEQRDNLAIISHSGEHLLALINDVLEMSKIEAGQIFLHETTFDLYSLLDNIKEMLQLKAEMKKLQLLFEWPADLPQYIQTDKVKLRQILINLLGNALKFTPQGSVKLKVNHWKINEGDREQCWLEFVVEDTGVGICEGDLEKIFEPFVQTKLGIESQEGTGLGLTITKRFVNLIGGEIKVSSLVDKGTTFTTTIPVKPISTAPAAVGTRSALLNY